MWRYEAVDVEDHVWKHEWVTYQVALLSASPSEDHDGFGAGTSLSTLKLILRANTKLTSFNVVSTRDDDWWSGGNGSQDSCGEELHVDGDWDIRKEKSLERSEG
jgi:hypothetical protein